MCIGFLQQLLSNSLKTSFSTRFGSYQWTHLLIGLCTAPAIFQPRNAAGIAWFNLGRSRCVFGQCNRSATNFDNALLALRMAFTRFREHGLKLKSRKCNFFKEIEEFLGKLVSGSGVSISTDKLEAAKQWLPWFHKLS